jgi:hypothetical protein
MFKEVSGPFKSRKSECNKADVKYYLRLQMIIYVHMGMAEAVFFSFVPYQF